MSLIEGLHLPMTLIALLSLLSGSGQVYGEEDRCEKPVATLRILVGQEGSETQLDQSEKTASSQPVSADIAWEDLVEIVAGVECILKEESVEDQIEEVASQSPALPVDEEPIQEPIDRAITPSDVYAKLELVHRKLDTLLTKLEIDSTTVIQIQLRERGVKPMHIYQLHLACLDQLRRFEQEKGWIAAPLIVASPVDYRPGDVYVLSSMLADRLDLLARNLEVGPLPNDLQAFEGKTPTDVYQRVVPVLCRLLALNQTTTLTPDEVFAQVVRTRIDAQAIISSLSQRYAQSPQRRRQLQAKAFGLSSDGNHFQLDTSTQHTPADAFQACLAARATMNQIRKLQGREAMPLPTEAASDKVVPADVMLQAQILIAELNLLKSLTGTTTPTPPSNLQHGKSCSDVTNQIRWTNYILEAVRKDLESAGALRSTRLRQQSR